MGDRAKKFQKWASTTTKRIGRRKELVRSEELLDTKLKRCLSTLDLTLLGIGHMMGSGIYVISPQVAQIAGPACVLSFVIAGVASMLAALAYAEFGARFPKAGSAYSYVYFSVGEITAFIVGWNVILENMLGVSAVVQACSSYIDSLADNAISNFTITHVGTLTDDPESYFNIEPHLLVIPIMVLFVVILMLGTAGTSSVGNVLCGVNILMICMIIGIGIFKGSFANWTNPDTGGFIPNGVKGVFQAAPFCFFSYCGFDAISSAGEEAKNPRKSLPIATILAMSAVTVFYTLAAACLTLLKNYTEITVSGGFPEVMQYVGMDWARYVISIGAMCGITTVTVVTLFTIVRATYAMAEDGLFSRFFAIISKRSQVPEYSMFMFAILSTTIAVFFKISTIIDMLSIGTLMAYMLVTCGLIVHRYSGTLDLDLKFCRFHHLEHRVSRFATQRTYIMANLGIIIFGCFGLSLTFLQVLPKFAYFTYSYFAMVILIPTVLIWILEQAPDTSENYQMPFMPFLPVLSIFINCHLMAALPPVTWLRLLIWLAIGFTIYFTYSVKNSKLESRAIHPPVVMVFDEKPNGYEMKAQKI